MKSLLIVWALILHTFAVSAQYNWMKPQSSEYKKEIGQLAQIYYNYTDYNQNNFRIEIFHLPFEYNELDSTKVYTISELIKFTEAKFPERLDSTLRYIDRRIKFLFPSTGKQVNAYCNQHFQEMLYGNSNSKFPSWLCGLPKYLLNLYDSVIDVNYKWVREAGSVRLIDTFYHPLKPPKKYDPWKPGYSIEGAKKLYREFSEIILILFNSSCIYRPNSDCRQYLSSDVYFARRKEFYDSAVRHYFNLNKNIEGLVHSDLYKDSKLSGTLKDWVRQSLSLSKEVLPDSLKNIVSNVKLDFDSNSGATLWFSNNGTDKIYISPYLIRAVYIAVITSPLHQDRILRPYNKGTKEYGGKDDTAKLKIMIAQFESEFKAQFCFLLSHELAHIYLHHGIHYDEYQADCYGWRYARNIQLNASYYNHITGRIEKKPNFGIFESIVVQSYKEGLAAAWGIHREGDVELQLSRFEKLKKYGEDDEVSCK